MPEYSIRDLIRKLRNIITEASLKPVVITRRNKPRLVLLSIETYRRLMARAEHSWQEPTRARPAA